MATANAFGGAGGASVFGGEAPGRRKRHIVGEDAEGRHGGSAIKRRGLERTDAIDGADGICLRKGRGECPGRLRWEHNRHYAGRRLRRGLRQPRSVGLRLYGQPSRQGIRRIANRRRGKCRLALLGPRDVVFGASILGTNGGGRTSATFDFNYHGDLLLGLIDDQPSVSGEFTIVANGVTFLDQTFTDPSIADSFFQDHVIDLGSFSGPAVDLTIGYNGGFGAFDFAVGGAVPEASTWAMMLLGFMGLGFAGWRRAHAGARSIA